MKATTSQVARSSSSCAACKFLKRKCTDACLFAPYFRSDEPKKFAKVHKVFGASNVGKILAEVPEDRREDAANSLVYEAEVRLSDPVYGCIGAIALLQQRMMELQQDLAVARGKLENCAAAARLAAADEYCQSNNNNYYNNVQNVVGGDYGYGSSSYLGFTEGFDWSELGSDQIGIGLISDGFGQIPFPL
ncbi:LOB domain-containing protein 21-like [Impatiens glandulifera]|uniref:LOB domain-containing protein 21-like n=1 Tax=Impatiens glandulifera TaxID=253017 RepID=UPI001FB07E6A|nr:LOB domain-containing protein 21-like [Impatiens glandulifera]